MLGIDPRAARAAWTVFLVALAIATAYAVRETLIVFVIALLFGYLLMPLVDLVARFTPRRVTFGFALAIVYLVLVGVILALAVTVGSRLVEEANNLATRLPDLLKNREWVQQLPLPGWLEPVRARINQALQDELNSGGKDILPYVKSLGGQLLSGAKYIVYVVLVPILAFFFLKDGRGIQQEIVNSLADEKRRPVIEGILKDIDRLLGEYIRALVLLAVASFAANVLFFAITGAPYMVLLAVLSGLGEFLPVVGPAGAAVLVLVVGGLAGYTHLLIYIVFWILFRMFQDYALSPYLMGKGVNVNPVLVLFGVLAGEQIGGVLGMFFSVPVIATLRVLFVRLRRTRVKDLVSANRDL
jgi:predicted PurR-regulated permease PerM